MIGTVQKPMTEILDALEAYDQLVVVGCDGCAKACQTGGTDQVAEMARNLSQAGKTVLLEVTPERTCYMEKTRHALDPHVETLGRAQALLVLGCGGAAQITRQVSEDYGLTVPIKIGLNSIGHLDTLKGGVLALEQCQECGDCVLNETGGICPVTKCAKSLLNGPCGGSENGRCEVDPERDCAWVLIYNRIAALGELDRLLRFVEPKDYGKMSKPRTLYLAEGRVS